MVQVRLYHAIRVMAVALAASGMVAGDGASELKRNFVKPPDDARIMMRWWWFGPAVTHGEIERELKVMQAASIGGVEIQPVYPLELDDPQKGIQTLPYLSDAFLDALRFAASTAESLGMRVDVTLGSGWPYGGPNTRVTQAAGKLRFERINVPEGVHSIPVASVENGEKVIGAFLGDQLVQPDGNGAIEIPAGLSGSDLLLLFISSRTGQQVKRAAVGAEGFVIDHYDRTAVEHHLASVADRLLPAFGGKPPYSVFSDSLEVFGSDWTDDFLPQFKARRGYDLLPHLPALVSEMGEETAAIRHDWAKTLTELVEDNYLKPLREWAHAHGTLFRSQTYGEPPVMLSSAQFVDLPEGEHGPYWRRFSDARWASSACHIYKKPVVSTETWTWLHSPAFRATPLDLKAEADRHFLEGINQLVGHGWPYSPPQAGEPGWRFYASAALNEHNPWFGVMPDLARYLQRISFLMRQGEPVNDVAIYLPTDDAWARLKPGSVALNEMIDSLLGPTLVPQVLNAGYNFDFIDDRMIEAVGVPYKVLILPGVERIPLGTLQQLTTYASGGGSVIATRVIPSRGTGWMEERTESARINELSNQLFHRQKGARFIENEADLGKALQELLTPDLAAGEAAPAIGFAHRRLPGMDIYFIANTSNRPVGTDAMIRTEAKSAEWWSPFTGKAQATECRAVSGRVQVRLELAPYESRVLVFGGQEASSPAPVHSGEAHLVQDLSTDWNVTFSGTGKSEHMDHLHSWTDDEATPFYSGEAVYDKRVNLDSGSLREGARITIDFGEGRPTEPGLAATNGMSALLDSPVRESAIVFVNGKRAGSVWCPPYQLDITEFLQTGENVLRIVGGNLAVNGMAGKSLPTYRLLNERYGERFVPQDMQNLRPIPSGVLGPVRLMAQ